MSFPTLNQFVQAIRASSDGGGGGELSPLGVPYRQSVYVDEPVFLYLASTNRTNAGLNLAFTGDGTNVGTYSGDVYDASPLNDSGAYVNLANAYFDCEATSGNPHIAVPYFAERQHTTAMSWEFVVRPTQSGVGMNIWTSSEIAAGGVDRVQISIVADGSTSVSLAYVNAGIAYSATVNAGMNLINVNQTHHVVVTVDNSAIDGEVKFYIDGVLVNTGELGGAVIGPTATTRDGQISGRRASGSSGYNNGYYKGYLGFLAQYDKILTADQVANHYNALNKRTFNPTPNITRYPNLLLDISTPTVLLQMRGLFQGSATGGFGDSSGNGNDGTRTGQVIPSSEGLGDVFQSSIFLPSSDGIAYVTIPYSAGQTDPFDECSIVGIGSLITGVADVGENRSASLVIYSGGEISGGSGNGNNYGRFVVTLTGMTYTYTSSAGATANVMSIDYTDEGFEDTVAGVSHHYACTVDWPNTEIKFYRDGELIGTVTMVATPDTTGSSVDAIIGASATNSANSSYGVMNHISYHRGEVLTPQQVLALARAVKYNDCSDRDVPYPIARYSFDDISGTDAPDNSTLAVVASTVNDGTLVNGLTRTTGYDGTANGALEFDQADEDYVSLGASFTEPSGAVTISAWIKTTATSGNRFIVDYGSNNGGVRSGMFLVMNCTTGCVYMVMGDGVGSVENTNWIKLESNTPINDGEWHHVIATTTGSGANIIAIDGQEVIRDTTSIAVGYDGNTHYANIGGYMPTDNASFTGAINCWDGEIDDVQIIDGYIASLGYNFLALTQLKPMPTDMVSYYDMETNSTSQLIDVIGGHDLDKVSVNLAYGTDGWWRDCLTGNGTTIFADAIKAVSASWLIDTFTISMFVRRPSDSGAGTTSPTAFSVFYQDGSGNRNGWELRLNSSFQFGYTEYTGSGATQNTSNSVIPDGLNSVARTLGAGVWDHIAVVRDETALTVKEYVNGVLVRTRDVGTAAIDFTDPNITVMALARTTSSGQAGPLDGDLCEIKWFDRACTDEEIESLSQHYIYPSGTGGGGSGDPVDPPVFDPVSLALDVTNINTDQPDGPWTSALITATPTDGSGQFTYLWTTDGQVTINTPTADDTTVSFNGSQQVINETLTCTITDAGDGDNTDTATCTINFSFGTTTDFVAHWTMDEADLTGLVMADQTANNHDATFDSAPNFQTGYDGQGFNSANNNSAVVADDADFKAAAFSVSLWAYIDPSEVAHTLFESGRYLGIGGAYQGFKLIRNTSNDSLQCFHGDGSGTTSGTDFDSLSTGAVCSDNVWEHYVVTYDGTDLKLYVNGSEEATDAPSFTIAWPSTNYVSLAAYVIDAIRYDSLTGGIDEIKVYDRELTSAEVTELYNLVGTPAAPTTPFSVSCDPSSTGGIVFPVEYTEYSVTAVVVGGVGPFTYNWTKENATSGLDIVGGQTSQTVTLGGVGSGEKEYVFQCEVTDTGNGDDTDSAITELFINWGAV